MSATKSWDTSIPRSERRTLWYFLALYILLVLTILSLLLFFYFRFQKELMLEQHRPDLREQAIELTEHLKWLHVHFDRERTYPRSREYRSAIYDSSKREIFSLLQGSSPELDSLLYLNEGVIHYIHQPESHYLGAKYVVIEIPDDRVWYYRSVENALIYGGFLFIFLLLIGIGLVKLLLSPMRRSISLLDRFIKDATHELNTPITAILTNIETFPKNHLDDKAKKKLQRIEIATRTIHNLYHDLSFLTLHQHLKHTRQIIDMNHLVQERADYCQVLAQSRKITIQLQQANENVHLEADPSKIARLIDNLLSNAIKYSHTGGIITMTLKNHQFAIEDQGIGMTEEELQHIHERYSRFDQTVGGFGIGSHIIKTIAEEYGLNLNYTSRKGQGTRVEVSWAS